MEYYSVCRGYWIYIEFLNRMLVRGSIDPLAGYAGKLLLRINIM